MTNKGKMIEAIYTACLTKRATLVIFYLINRANQELTCFPSVGTIAKECNISTRTVQRALNDLEEADFLERESRFHRRGGQKSSFYKINPKVIVENEIEEVKFVCMNTKHELNNESECVKKTNRTTSMNLEEKGKEKNRQENIVYRLLCKVKKGCFHILLNIPLRRSRQSGVA